MLMSNIYVFFFLSEIVACSLWAFFLLSKVPVERTVNPTLVGRVWVVLCFLWMDCFKMLLINLFRYKFSVLNRKCPEL